MKNLVLIFTAIIFLSLAIYQTQIESKETSKKCLKGNCNNGKGTLLENGSEFTGEFKNGLKHGKFIRVFPDGLKHVGSWENDKPVGIHNITFPDGMFIEGPFESLKNKDGWIIEGINIHKTAKLYNKGEVLYSLTFMKENSMEIWDEILFTDECMIECKKKPIAQQYSCVDGEKFNLCGADIMDKVVSTNVTSGAIKGEDYKSMLRGICPATATERYGKGKIFKFPQPTKNCK